MGAAFSGARRIHLAAAYAKSSGSSKLLKLGPPRGSRAIVGLGFGVTDPLAVEQLEEAGMDVKVVPDGAIAATQFHPKLYLVERPNEHRRAGRLFHLAVGEHEGDPHRPRLPPHAVVRSDRLGDVQSASWEVHDGSFDTFAVGVTDATDDTSAGYPQFQGGATPSRAPRALSSPRPGRRPVRVALLHASSYTSWCTVVLNWEGTMSKTRTNIELDDDIVEAAMQLYGTRSKKETVDLALRRLVGVRLSRDDAIAMEGSGWEGDLGRMRDDAPPDTA